MRMLFLGLAIAVSALIAPVICDGSMAEAASVKSVNSSEGLMLALKDAKASTIVLNGEGLSVTRLCS